MGGVSDAHGHARNAPDAPLLRSVPLQPAVAAKATDMKKFLISAALLMTGCDNAFVVENIDVFTCSWLPPWMADCASEEVHDKAVSLLQFGLVEAKVTCEDVPFHSTNDCDVSQRSDATYTGHRLADGSALVTLDQQTYLLGRV